MFGLQFYGECWSGSNRPPLGSDSYSESKKCISFQYEKCQNNDPNECVGEAMTNYVYRIMEGKKKDKNKDKNKDNRYVLMHESGQDIRC